MNSLNSKFDDIQCIIPGNIDVMIFVETKLDDSFPTSQFSMDGFAKPFRRDRNKFGGGILIYVREDIPCKLLNNHSFPDDIEGLFVELNFRKSKLLLLGTYHPPSQQDNYYFQSIGDSLDIYCSFYEKCVLVGDFNAEENEESMKQFLQLYGLKNLVRENTCFKSLNNPSCIDLILTNSHGSFQNTNVISSGLSDFHKLVLSVVKTTFPKAKPRHFFYRDFKNFEENIFKDDLKRCLHANTDTSVNFRKFQEVFLNVLAIHAPIKQKYIRANEVPYMTKVLRKAIMTRSRLENKYQKTNSLVDKDLYKKHKNYCNRLYKRERKKYYNNIKLNNITDNKKFWGTMKPFLTDKGVSRNKISLIEGNKIITEDSDVAETLNNYFDAAVSLLRINEPSQHLTENHHVIDPIDSILLTFSNHPSILTINSIMINSSSSFSFHITTLTEIQNEINSLDTKKSNPVNSISAQHLKAYADICSNYLHNIINSCIINSSFDDGMKLADISPIHKKDEFTNKSNYRPISGLPAGSKIFGRIIQGQIGHYMETFLSPYLCGYRKGYSVQHALIALLEKLRVSLDNKGYGGAILMDLSKAFDTLNHDLLIAKLHAYGFSRNALKLIKSYLSNRWQRTKINNSYSSWIELLRGVPQGSILGPLLFNIYLNDLFLLL